MSKSMRSFRLSDETQTQLTIIAARHNVNQTEAVELAVQDLYHRGGPEQIEPEGAFAGTDEALAKEYDDVADLYETDDGLSPRLRNEVSRLMRNTAKSLRS